MYLYLHTLYYIIYVYIYIYYIRPEARGVKLGAMHLLRTCKISKTNILISIVSHDLASQCLIKKSQRNLQIVSLLLTILVPLHGLKNTKLCFVRSKACGFGPYAIVAARVMLDCLCDVFMYTRLPKYWIRPTIGRVVEVYIYTQSFDKSTQNPLKRKTHTHYQFVVMTLYRSKC
jgi:hypothetical protein